MTDLELLSAIAQRFGWTPVNGGWIKDVPNDHLGEAITHRILTKTGRAGSVDLLDTTDNTWRPFHRVEHSSTASLIRFLVD